MKRFLLSLFLALLLSSDGLAQTPPSYLGSVGDFWYHTNSFTCSLMGLANTLTQCQAASAAGLRYYITSIAVQTTTATAGTFNIQTGTGSNCATGAAPLFPSVSGSWTAPINTQPTSSILFNPPLKAPLGSALCVIGTLTNTINIQIMGYTQP
jgi:hypothetical protein